MAGPRWDELERAIRSKDSEAAERLWLELLEQDGGNVEGFLKAGDGIAEKAGGRRQAGVLLWMVAGALKDKGRDKDLVRLYVRLAKVAPDDGTLRQALTDAVRAGYAGRADVEALLEKSGVVAGQASDLAKQAESARALPAPRARRVRLPQDRLGHRPDRRVPPRSRQVRHRLPLEGRPRDGHPRRRRPARAPARRRPARHGRVPAATRSASWRPRGPLDVLRKVILKLEKDAPLRHVKDTLVPDVVDKTGWAAWWKEAKKHAPDGPRVHGGRRHRPAHHVRRGRHRRLHDAVPAPALVRADGPRPPARRQGLRQDRRAGRGRAGDPRAAGQDRPRARPPDRPLQPHLVVGDRRRARGPQRRRRARAHVRRASPTRARCCARSTPTRRATSRPGPARSADRPDGAQILLELALEEDLVVADAYADRAVDGEGHPHARPAAQSGLRRPDGAAAPLRVGRRAASCAGAGPVAPPTRPRIVEQVLRVLDATAYAAKRETDARQAQGRRGDVEPARRPQLQAHGRRGEEGRRRDGAPLPAPARPQPWVEAAPEGEARGDRAAGPSAARWPRAASTRRPRRRSARSTTRPPASSACAASTTSSSTRTCPRTRRRSSARASSATSPRTPSTTPPARSRVC